MNKIQNRKIPKWAIAVIIMSFIINIVGCVVFFVFLFMDIADDIYEDLTIYKTESFYDEKEGTYVITGVVYNDSQYDYYDVVVKYALYDENGNIIDVVDDYLGELEEGEKWKFSVEYSGQDVKEIDHYELTELEGY